MKNREIRIFTAFFITLILAMSFSVTAFAGGGEDIPPIPTETPKQDPVPLTPDGNLTLVDDIEGEQSEYKQFVTVVSKNGNYFYLIIDRAGDKENVYFLNLVDEADLLALIEEDKPKEPEKPKSCICSDKCELGSVNGDCPVCSADLKKCLGKAVVEEKPQEKPKGGIGGTLAILLVLMLAAGGGYYYFKIHKNKPKSTGNTDLEEYDFDDDEDDMADEETVLEEESEE